MLRSNMLPAEEFAERIDAFRGQLVKEGLDAGIVTSPENIFYLTGLDHQGYFGPHGLIVPKDGRALLACRAHEKPTVERQVQTADFIGYADTVSPGIFLSEHIKKAGLGDSRLGVQSQSLGFPPAYETDLRNGLPDAEWSDISGMIEKSRLVKSDNEIALIRRAAAISDAIMETALSTAAIGEREEVISAEVHRRMFEMGGEYVGFGPFIRSGERLPYEHEVWTDRRVAKGEQLMLEMAACVGRYHAPVGRLAFAGAAPTGTQEVVDICIAAQEKVLEVMRPGNTGREVYQAWQSVLDDAGLAHYRRHHCGYNVGIAFPPTWTGGIGVVSMHSESDMVLEKNMVFHQLSWLLGCGRGDYFVSDTVRVTDTGGERMTQAARELHVFT